ncbi:CPBP family intramembrane glutamic endopeptidase [Romboutsia lituseburensis]|uniref:CPBP family intramembrane glutamic endopeptidase n=1 Tax=Romboutsia lituseburensis TaxID=1537 RepID=UPI00215B087B|nr:CPBP family intramembrane metalloprotease [Romboutsia lituseburensis]MCR8746301.1 CPBP family intramembrane metalloprotease [Romboutsia lituseburensis]
MNKKKIAIFTTIIYVIVLGSGLYLYSWFVGNKVNEVEKLLVSLISQIIAVACVVYIINKYYGWKNIGFRKIKLKSIIWFFPYIVIIVPMIYEFIIHICKNITSFSVSTWAVLFITFIGASSVGFSEEAIFRGIYLESFKSEKTVIRPMIISYLGFSIFHIVNLFVGNSFAQVFITIIVSSLLGFSFIALAIKLESIWLNIIFHTTWNFILISSQTLNFSVSKTSGFISEVNILVGSILWLMIIKKDKIERKKSFITNENKKTTV